jgi:hypothetical protein
VTRAARLAFMAIVLTAPALGGCVVTAVAGAAVGVTAAAVGTTVKVASTAVGATADVAGGAVRTVTGSGAKKGQ